MYFYIYNLHIKKKFSPFASHRAIPPGDERANLYPQLKFPNVLPCLWPGKNRTFCCHLLPDSQLWLPQLQSRSRDLNTEPGSYLVFGTL